MLRNDIIKYLSLEYQNRLLIGDYDHFFDLYDYIPLLKEFDFTITQYRNIEEFRYAYETEIKTSSSKYAVIIPQKIYIPYDVYQSFLYLEISLKKLYPKLESSTLAQYIDDIDLISYAYKSCYENYVTAAQTKTFIEKTAFSKDIVFSFAENEYIPYLYYLTGKASSYIDWIEIAKEKAKLTYYGVLIETVFDIDFIQVKFESFLFEKYQTLSSEVNTEFPPILPRTIQTLKGNKKALIIMDGMSMFDFKCLSYYLEGIKYDQKGAFALIPTITSISRQCLVSGKYPKQLEKPFSLEQEEKLFYQNLFDNGYRKEEIFFTRDHNIDINPFTRFVLFINVDIDDAVHSEYDRTSMLDRLKRIGKTKKIQKCIQSLVSRGFTVYITADHGNTPCVGAGRLHNNGIGTISRSKRMVVYKDYADIPPDMQDNIMQWPPHYLDDQYKYYVCKSNKTFDIKGEEEMSHGGIDIDEVIVPFIKITGVS